MRGAIHRATTSIIMPDHVSRPDTLGFSRWSGAGVLFLFSNSDYAAVGT